MKIRMMAVAAVLMTSAAGSAMAEDVEILSGDKRLACEAIMCLAAPSRPGECTASIRKYFSITASKPSRLAKKRRNFLKLCPQDNDALVEQIVRNGGAAGAGGGGDRPSDPGVAQEQL